MRPPENGELAEVRLLGDAVIYSDVASFMQYDETDEGHWYFFGTDHYLRPAEVEVLRYYRLVDTA